VAGGAPTVVAALMAVLTDRGTLLMPTFNHGAPFEAGGAGFFDPGHTPTRNGAIPEHFWRQPGVLRSLDPTHPVAAWGLHARGYVAEHHRTLTMGPRSPLGRLLADGGHGLLLGVDYSANSFHHVVETALDAPCLGKRSEAYPVRLPDGGRVLGRTWGWRNAPCPHTDAGRYGDIMGRRGLHRQAQIGQARATFFKLADCFSVVAELLQQGAPEAPPCARCPVRPAKVAATVESDWDDDIQQPRPESMAWRY
jgi:aminoglycoside 3-N-acetyltransferase